jgi:hypothetical protein
MLLYGFKDLAYSIEPSVENIVKQVFFVNRSYFAKNMMIEGKKNDRIVAFRRAKGKCLYSVQVDRYLNNDTPNDIASLDMIIFRSGKLRGMGVLAKEFVDVSRGDHYMVWLPALRKVRRFARPTDDGGLAEADIAFLEEAKLRHFEDEIYELLGTKEQTFRLGFLPVGEKNRYASRIPKVSVTMTKKVHIVKSSTVFSDHWYDYHISYIDPVSFINYKSIYYKNDQKIKVVDRHWKKVETLDDQRAFFWNYWFSHDLQTDAMSMTYIPHNKVKVNQKMKPSFWSIRRLQKIKR